MINTWPVCQSWQLGGASSASRYCLSLKDVNPCSSYVNSTEAPVNYLETGPGIGLITTYTQNTLV